jgi:hypothetical protein
MADILRTLVEEVKKRLQPVVKQVSSGAKQYTTLAKQYTSPGAYLVSKIKPTLKAKVLPAVKEFGRGFMTLPEAGKPETFLDKGWAGVGQAVSMLPPVAAVVKTAPPKAGKIAYKIAPTIGKTVPKAQKLLLEAPKVLEGTKGAVKQAFKIVRRQKTPMPAFKIVQKAGEKAIALTKKVEELKKIPTIITKTGEVKPLMGRGGLIAPKFNFTKWRDKVIAGRERFGRETQERNIEDIAPKEDFIKMKKFLFDKIKDAETVRVLFVNNLITKFQNKVVKEFGIRIGSFDDKLIQRFGEKRMSLKELKLATPKWREVQKAASMFRRQYDELLDMVNEVRKRYGYDPILRREDYFTHFKEIDNLIKEFGITFKSPQLPTKIGGITQFFKPGKPFSPYELARKGGEYTEGAIEGFNRYIHSISKQIFRIDPIQRARIIEKSLSDLPEAQHLKVFKAQFSRFVQDLAGKKSSVDVAMQEHIPIISKSLNYLASKTGANMVGGSFSTAIMQLLPFTQHLAQTSKRAVLKGIIDTMRSPLDDDFRKIAGQTSKILVRRYPKEFIDLKTFANPLSTQRTKITESANIMFKVLDIFSVRSIVAGKFFENLRKGFNSADALKLADDYAGRLVQERTWGQYPAYFTVQAFRPFTQFQLEANNYLSNLFKDIPRMSKNTLEASSMIGQAFLYAFIGNSLIEKLTGRRPLFDPIDWVLVTLDRERTGPQKIKKIAREMADQLPLVSLGFGGRIPLASRLPTGKEIGEIIEKPSEIPRALARTAAYIVMPTGGGQIKKAITGMQALYKGGVFTPSGMLKYPVAKDVGSALQAILFGPYSGKGARFYFDNELKPLSEKETLVWQAAIKRGNELYQTWATIYRFKLANGLRTKMLLVAKDLRMSPEEKRSKLRDILNEYQILMNRLGQFSGLEDVLVTQGAVGSPLPSPSLPTAPKVATGQVLLKRGKTRIKKPTLTTRKLKPFKMKKAKYRITQKKPIPIYKIKPSKTSWNLPTRKEVIAI